MDRIAIEVTHLCCHQNCLLVKPNKNGFKNGSTLPPKEDLICKQLKYLLCGSDENIGSIDLKCISFEDKTPNLRNYYEEKELFRLSGSISFRRKQIDLIKNCFSKICDNNVFKNTVFALNDQRYDVLEYISDINHLIPRQTFRSIESFSLGTIIDLTTFVEHYSSRTVGALNVAKDDIIADFQYDKKRLLLHFRLTSGGINGKYTKNIRYKMEVEYKAINSALFATNRVNKRKVVRIYFILNHPPILYKVFADDNDMSFEEQLKNLKNHFRYDQRKPYHKQKIYKTIESNKGVHNNEIQNWEKWIRDNEFLGCNRETIGKSNVLMLEIPIIADEKKFKENRSEVPDPYRVLYYMKRFSNKPIYFSFIETIDGFNDTVIKEKLFNKISAPFAVKYAFHSVFHHSFQSSDELLFKNKTKEFIEKVNEFSKIDAKAVQETLEEILGLMDRNAIFCTINAFEIIFKDFKEMNEKMKNEKISVKSFNTEIEYIRRCILTPTRMLFLPPQPTLRSRFIVNSDPEYTIRLSIREDDLLSLQYTVRNQESFLQNVIKVQLMKGIQIEDRLFEFLGSSSSQLRDTGMVLYARDREGRTAHSIRESIGDMSCIRKNVAKYVARLGLAFSQVMTHIEVDQRLTEVIEDIESDDKQYIFSDGIGKVSIDIMEMVYQKLKIECRHRPSAMQIRYGGCKGMLVVDPTLKGDKKIIFRESMRKYESDSHLLGIIKLSAPRPLYLNRPLITILEQLGVKPNVFLTMLMENLKNLANAMICECSATPLLQNSSTLGIPYRKLYKSGIPFLSEPIFRQIIDSVIKHRMNELRIKARIKVPMNCGRTVFGVLDETGTLEYGQVFVQLSNVDEDNMPEETTLILSGEIMITKFPCLHPGDVRKMTAVDVKALHHIKDCIVFPQRGSRPHPNEMAGSDLDGDEYAVIWNSPLIFENPNEEPMNFPESEPILLENDATVEDILSFYCDYIVCNNVGLLASAHLANSDRLEGGIFSDICMNLARKYAIALDFAKTGRIESIEWSERPKIYPDFMEKFAEKATYLSKNVLGQLYRHCSRYGLGINTNSNLEFKAVPNLNFIKEGWQTYEKSATDAYKTYRSKIIYLLNRFGVDSEATLLSGAFTKTSKYMTGRTETNDVHELLENIINKLFIDFKNRFNSECENSSQKERNLRASAWYLIPFKIDDQYKERYFGFSWTITEDICKLMSNCDKFKVYKADHNCVQMATELIDEYFKNHFIYCEPIIDPSDDECLKRQKIMAERCLSSETVLKAWLERQDHLFFKRRVGKKVLSSTDSDMSDMDRKLRRILMKIRIDILAEARDHLDVSLKSAGHLVMSFLKCCIDEWLDIKTSEENNRIVETPLVKFGFSALMTLNHFFKTREISHIIKTGPRFTISLKSVIKDETFHISLPLPKRNTNGLSLMSRESKEKYRKTEEYNEKIRKYVEFMVQRPEDFCEKLKLISGAIDVHLEPYPLNSKQLQYYYLLTATGTVWSLQAIKNFICHPQFFKIVANSGQRWKRRNLFCNGMPDPMNNPIINSNAS